MRNLIALLATIVFVQAMNISEIDMDIQQIEESELDTDELNLAQTQ